MTRTLLVTLLALTGCASSGEWIGDHAYTRIACDPGTADCDGRLTTGCETRTATDVTACGACGHACAAGERCDDGHCAR